MSQSLKAKQRKAVRALLSERTQEAAAQAVGVSRQTLLRWLRQEAFQQALHEAESELLAAACRRLVSHVDVAISVVLRLMADAEFPPAIRLRSALAILDFTLRLRELYTLEERISRLEQAYAERSPEPSSPARTRTERSERVHVNGASAAQHR